MAWQSMQAFFFPWGLYAVFTYGSPLPHSMLPKSAAIYRVDRVTAVLDAVPLVPRVLVLLVLGAQDVADRLSRLWLEAAFTGVVVAGGLVGASWTVPTQRENDYLQIGAYTAELAPFAGRAQPSAVTRCSCTAGTPDDGQLSSDTAL